MMILKYFKIKLFLNFEREDVNFIVKLEEFKKEFDLIITLITYLKSVKL